MSDLLLKKPARLADEAPKPPRPTKASKPDWLGKFDAEHYRLGRDEVWVIGRLPGPVVAPKRRSRG